MDCGLRIADCGLKSPKRRSASLAFATGRGAPVGVSLFSFRNPRKRSGAFRNSSRGFTLIEILTATLIFAVLIAALYGVFYGAIRLRETTYEKVERGLPRDYVLSVIRRDLADAVPPVGILAGPLVGVTDTVGSRRADRIEFFTASGTVTDGAPWGDVLKVAYYLVDPISAQPAAGGKSSGGTFDLVRATRRNLLASVEEDPVEERLLSGVRSLEIVYFDGTGWVDSWDSTTVENETPSAVRVRIGLASAQDAAQEASGVQTGAEETDADAATLELVCEIVAKAREANAPAAAPPSSNGGGRT